MRPLRYSINLTLDGCIDHTVGLPDAETHQHSTELITQADAILFGRVTYQMMESAFRIPASGEMPGWMEPWMHAFARGMHGSKKYVVSNTLPSVDWNSELLLGDLGEAVQRLKQQPGQGLFVAGTKLALALAELGLIDEYEFIVQPRLAGHGPYLFAGLSKIVDLKLVGRKEFTAGAVALRYAPKERFAEGSGPSDA